MMTRGKAILIEFIIMVVSFIIWLLLFAYFESKGLKKPAEYSIFFLFQPIGIYTIFGKYVSLKSGIFPAPLAERLAVGLFEIFIVPVMYFIIKFVRA